jgi:hypothetical protein
VFFLLGRLHTLSAGAVRVHTPGIYDGSNSSRSAVARRYMQLFLFFSKGIWIVAPTHRACDDDQAASELLESSLKRWLTMRSIHSRPNSTVEEIDDIEGLQSSPSI